MDVFGRTANSPTSPTGSSISVSGSRIATSYHFPALSPAAPVGRSSPYGLRIGHDVSVVPYTSTNASMPNRDLKPARIEDAVGAANTQRSELSASSARAGCFQTKSIITPRKLVTVTSCSRSWSTQRLALKRERITARPPAMRAG